VAEVRGVKVGTVKAEDYNLIILRRKIINWGQKLLYTTEYYLKLRE
jgi:hypothetical protein